MLPEEIKRIKRKGEDWKPYAPYPCYWVSNRGRLYSSTRVGTKGGLMSPFARDGGYVTISIGYQKEPNVRRYKQAMVHRMVLETFDRLPKPYEQGNHKDGDKHNNDIRNLEWTTRLGNARHAVEVLDSYRKGETHGRAKLTEREAKFICWLKGTYGDVIQPGEIGNFFGTSKTTIINLWKGVNWKCLKN
jgi:hypothetical protein